MTMTDENVADINVADVDYVDVPEIDGADLAKKRKPVIWNSNIAEPCARRIYHARLAKQTRGRATEEEKRTSDLRMLYRAAYSWAGAVDELALRFDVSDSDVLVAELLDYVEKLPRSANAARRRPAEAELLCGRAAEEIARGAPQRIKGEEGKLRRSRYFIVPRDQVLYAKSFPFEVSGGRTVKIKSTPDLVIVDASLESAPVAHVELFAPDYDPQAQEPSASLKRTSHLLRLLGYVLSANNKRNISLIERRSVRGVKISNDFHYLSTLRGSEKILQTELGALWPVYARRADILGRLDTKPARLDWIQGPSRPPYDTVCDALPCKYASERVAGRHGPTACRTAPGDWARRPENKW